MNKKEFEITIDKFENLVKLDELIFFMENDIKVNEEVDE